VADNFRKELEQRVADSEATVERDVKDFLAVRERLLSSIRKARTWREALADESSKNGHAYIAAPVKTAADQFLGLSNGTSAAKSSRQSTTPPLITKTGAVRDTIRENPGLKPKQIHDKILAKKFPLTITYADVQRAIPKLLNQEKIKRDDNGGLLIKEN
jgi:hypothetical protein